MLIGIILRVLAYFIHMSMFLSNFVYQNAMCLRQKLHPLYLTLGTVLPEP